MPMNFASPQTAVLIGDPAAGLSTKDVETCQRRESLSSAEVRQVHSAAARGGCRW